jgi:hypothetical protein
MFRRKCLGPCQLGKFVSATPLTPPPTRGTKGAATLSSAGNPCRSGLDLLALRAHDAAAPDPDDDLIDQVIGRLKALSVASSPPNDTATEHRADL